MAKSLKVQDSSQAQAEGDQRAPRRLSPEDQANLLDVWVDDHLGSRKVGVLERYAEEGNPKQSTVVFYYLDGNNEADAISITMPIRRKPYLPKYAGLIGNLPPVFDQNIPEGALHAYLVQRYRKVVENMGDFDLLRLAGNRSIGRLRAVPHNQVPNPESPESPSIDTILSDPDAQALLESLYDRLAPYSGVSGVQPKVLAEEQKQGVQPASKLSGYSKLTMQNESHIIKAAGREYPGLTINEYLCLRACEMSKLNTAKARLSDDGSVLVLTRFDKDENGRPMGFEDMACLSGLTSQEKYSGSYEEMTRRLIMMIEPERRSAVLAELFRSIALSCVLGNGDAHLKNFGLIYSDPTRPAFLAPAYDICCTLAYLSNDQLALSMGASNKFPDRSLLTRFGRLSCRLTKNEVDSILEDVAIGVEIASIELDYYCNIDPQFNAQCGEGMHRAWTAGMRHTLGMGATYELPTSEEQIGTRRP